MPPGSKNPPEQVSLVKLDLRYAKLRLAQPKEMARLKASIERQGVRHPVVIATAVEPGRWVVVDGFKRVRVIQELGGTQVLATLLPLDALAAEVAMMQCNAPHRGLCDLEEAWIVRSLCRVHRLKQLDVARMLMRNKSWVCRRLKLVEQLESAIADDIRLGLLSATVAREIARLPRGNQVATASAIREHGLASRQAGLLVQKLLKTDQPSACREVLADPMRFLGQERTESVQAEDPRLSSGGNDVRKSLLMFHGAAGRLWRSLERHAPAGLCGDEARVLRSALEQALEGGHRTTVKLEQLIASSGTQVSPATHA